MGLLALLLCLGLCTIANATLTVGTDPDPVTFVPGGTVSQRVELRSPDYDPAMGTGHAVTGGRLVMMIQPIGVTTGSVQFDTSLSGGATGLPNGAVTNAGSKYGITTYLPGNPAYSAGETMADVFWTPIMGGQRPVSANDPLVAVNYTASSDATGTFGLYLVYDMATNIQLMSHWRGAGTTPNTSSVGSPFDMTFNADGKALIGTITVVPEPVGFALIGLIGLLCTGKFVSERFSLISRHRNR